MSDIPSDSSDTIPTAPADASSSTVVVHHTTIADDYDLRKQPHVQIVKGLVSMGKTVRRRTHKSPSCATCGSRNCKHLDASSCKYTDNSRNQKKNVHKCDCCMYTHVCEHLIPVRGRDIKPDTD